MLVKSKDIVPVVAPVAERDSENICLKKGANTLPQILSMTPILLENLICRAADVMIN